MAMDKPKTDADHPRDKDGHFIAKDAAPKPPASGKPAKPAPKQR